MPTRNSDTEPPLHVMPLAGKRPPRPKPEEPDSVAGGEPEAAGRVQGARIVAPGTAAKHAVFAVATHPGRRRVQELLK
jgi:hypothetical protein